MATRWIIMTIMPIVAFGAKKADDLFLIEPSSEQSLLHIVIDSEEAFENESQLSLLEMDEQDESLLPWDLEDLSEGESFVSSQKAPEEYEDVFSFDLTSKKAENGPTHERVLKERSLFSKPRVVPAQP